ncbi:MAG: hypothetical protein K2K06_11650 [Oscillospiraceae bacterium]|nr:hypothetical protein [Oscillospiraceae bacterium]
MRDYKLVAQRVFQRRDEYLLAKKRKKRRIIYTAIPISLCVLFATGIAYRHGNSSGELQTVEQETTNFSDFDKQEQATESQTIFHPSVETEDTDNTKLDTDFITVTETNQLISESFSATEPTELTESTELTSEPLFLTETIATSSEILKEVITTETQLSFTTESTEPTEPSMIIDNPPETQQPNDYRITVEAFEPTPEQLSQVVQQTVSSDFEMNYTSLEQLFQDTGATILCKVLSVVNTIRDNKPYTVYTVEVTESVYGSFVAGDLLSIVQYGGYILQENDSVDLAPPLETSPSSCYDPSDETNSMSPPFSDGENSNEQTGDPSPPPVMDIPSKSEILIEEQLAYSETPNVSQEYVLFISPDSLFDGAYATLNQNEGVFKVDPETGELIRNAEQGEAINSVSYETVKETSQNFVNSTN